MTRRTVAERVKLERLEAITIEAAEQCGRTVLPVIAEPQPLVGELFRSGFLMQAAAAQNDFITPAVVSAAEADYERNLANTVELFHILGEDPTHGAHNIALFNKWLVKHAELALDASNHLQPIWSQPRVKVAVFSDALGHAKNRIKSIAAELGLKIPANLAS